MTVLAVHVSLSQFDSMSERVWMKFIKNNIMTNIFSCVTEQLLLIQLIRSFLCYFFYMKYSVFLSTGIHEVQTKKDIPHRNAL